MKSGYTMRGTWKAQCAERVDQMAARLGRQLTPGERADFIQQLIDIKEQGHQDRLATSRRYKKA